MAEYVICKSKSGEPLTTDNTGFVDLLKKHFQSSESSVVKQVQYYQMVIKDLKPYQCSSADFTEDFEYFFSLVQPTNNAITSVTEEIMLKCTENSIGFFKNLESINRNEKHLLVCRVVKIEKNPKYETFVRKSYGYGVCAIADSEKVHFPIFPVEKDASVFDAIDELVYSSVISKRNIYQIQVSLNVLNIPFETLINQGKQSRKIQHAPTAIPQQYVSAPKATFDYYTAALADVQCDAKEVVVSCRDVKGDIVKGALSIGGVQMNEISLLLDDRAGQKFAERVKITLPQYMSPDSVHFFFAVKKPFATQLKAFGFLCLRNSNGVVHENSIQRVQLFKFPSKGLEQTRYLFPDAKLSPLHENHLKVQFSSLSTEHPNDAQIEALLKTKKSFVPNSTISDGFTISSEQTRLFTVKIIDALLYNFENQNSQQTFENIVTTAGNISLSERYSAQQSALDEYIDKDFSYSSVYNNIIDRMTNANVTSLKKFKALPYITKIICASFRLRLNNPKSMKREELLENFQNKSMAMIENGIITQMAKNPAIASIVESTFVSSVLPFKEYFTAERFASIFMKIQKGQTKNVILSSLANTVVFDDNLSPFLVPVFINSFLENPSLASIALFGSCINYLSRESVESASITPNLSRQITQCFVSLLPLYKTHFLKKNAPSLSVSETSQSSSQDFSRLELAGVFISTLAVMLKTNEAKNRWKEYTSMIILKEIVFVTTLLTSFLRSEIIPSIWYFPSLFVINTVQATLITIIAIVIVAKYKIDIQIHNRFFYSIFSSSFALLQNHIRFDVAQTLTRTHNCQLIFDSYVDLTQTFAPMLKNFWSGVGNKGTFTAPLSEDVLRLFNILDPSNQMGSFEHIVFFYYSILKEVFSVTHNLDEVTNKSINGINAIGSSRKIKPVLINLFFEKRILPNAANENDRSFEQAVQNLKERLFSALSVLFDYMSIPEDNEYQEERLFEGARMMAHFKDIDQENSLQYLYNIYDEHIGSKPQNKLEAGLIFLEHAKLLQWSEERIDVKVKIFKGEQISANLKKKLFLNAHLCMSEVAAHYQAAKINEELCKYLYDDRNFNLASAKVNERIDDLERFSSGVSTTIASYFFVEYIGTGFAVTLQNKSFVYKTHIEITAKAFQERLAKKFSNIRPKFVSKLSDKSSISKGSDLIVLFKVFPSPSLLSNDIPWEFRTEQLHMNISLFQNRPTKSGELIQKFRTRESFPFILTRSDVINVADVCPATQVMVTSALCWTKIDEIRTLVERGNLHKKIPDLTNLLNECVPLVRELTSNEGKSLASQNERFTAQCALETLSSLLGFIVKSVEGKLDASSMDELSALITIFVNKVFKNKQDQTRTEADKLCDAYLSNWHKDTQNKDLLTTICGVFFCRFAQTLSEEFKSCLSKLLLTQASSENTIAKSAAKCGVQYDEEIENSLIQLINAVTKLRPIRTQFTKLSEIKTEIMTCVNSVQKQMTSSKSSRQKDKNKNEKEKQTDLEIALEEFYLSEEKDDSNKKSQLSNLFAFLSSTDDNYKTRDKDKSKKSSEKDKEKRDKRSIIKKSSEQTLSQSSAVKLNTSKSSSSRTLELRRTQTVSTLLNQNEAKQILQRTQIQTNASQRDKAIKKTRQTSLRTPKPQDASDITWKLLEDVARLKPIDPDRDITNEHWMIMQTPLRECLLIEEPVSFSPTEKRKQKSADTKSTKVLDKKKHSDSKKKSASRHSRHSKDTQEPNSSEISNNNAESLRASPPPPPPESEESDEELPPPPMNEQSEGKITRLPLSSTSSPKTLPPPPISRASSRGPSSPTNSGLIPMPSAKPSHSHSVSSDFSSPPSENTIGDLSISSLSSQSQSRASPDSSRPTSVLGISRPRGPPARPGSLIGNKSSKSDSHSHGTVEDALNEIEAMLK